MPALARAVGLNVAFQALGGILAVAVAVQGIHRRLPAGCTRATTRTSPYRSSRSRRRRADRGCGLPGDGDSGRPPRGSPSLARETRDSSARVAVWRQRAMRAYITSDAASSGARDPAAPAGAVHRAAVRTVAVLGAVPRAERAACCVRNSQFPGVTAAARGEDWDRSSVEAQLRQLADGAGVPRRRKPVWLPREELLKVEQNAVPWRREGSVRRCQDGIGLSPRCGRRPGSTRLAHRATSSATVIAPTPGTLASSTSAPVSLTIVR